MFYVILTDRIMSVPINMRDNLHLLNELRSEGEDITHLRHVQLLPSQFTFLSLIANQHPERPLGGVRGMRTKGREVGELALLTL